MSWSAPQAAATVATPFSHNARTGAIQAWDLATWSGWCHGHVSDRMPRFGTIRLTDRTADARFCAFQDTVEEMVERMQPGQIVIERALPLPAQTSMRVTEQQLTLRGMVRMAAWRNSVPVFEIDPGTVRKDILGQRYFAKDTVKREVVRYCQRRGWRVPDHNAGDACLVWLWYVRLRMGVRPAAGPLFADIAA